MENKNEQIEHKIVDENKQTTVNINHLVDKVIIVTSSPNASNVEIQEQIVEAITKAIKEAEMLP